MAKVSCTTTKLNGMLIKKEKAGSLKSQENLHNIKDEWPQFPVPPKKLNGMLVKRKNLGR